MINAEEHNKLLAQIAELEKDSVNYFDVDKEFFLIDSDNLGEVETCFYGYSIQANGIHENDNLTRKAVDKLDGRGCYVYVEAQKNKITIKQDLNGCWGVYLFRYGDYFAISNSFFHLVDHVKQSYALTPNRDYCHYLLLNDVCSNACAETAIKEIEVVDRNATLWIDIADKSLQIEKLDFKEHTVPLDSAEGMATLDNWFGFWCELLRGLTQYTNFIQADLSGGLGSRISFLLLLKSGVDLSKVQINSIEDDSHAADFDIASQIAAHYDFKLNQPFPARQTLNYSLNDIFNLNLYGGQTFRNVADLGMQKGVDKVYSLDGFGGEVFQDTWRKSPKTFTEDALKRTQIYYRDLKVKLSRSVETILQAGFRAVSDKHKIRNADSIDIPQRLYLETQCRNCYGKDALRNYLNGNVQLSPWFDPAIRTLSPTTKDCSDYNLLTALILTRYEPQLLEFPFEGNRTIAPETIDYARKLNERFPRSTPDESSKVIWFHCQSSDSRAKKLLNAKHNNPKIASDLVASCLKAMFESGKTYGLFSAYFDTELYHVTPVDQASHLYTVLGIAKVLEDVEISSRNRPQYQTMTRFLEEDFTAVYDDAQILRNIIPYITARIDIKLTPKGKGKSKFEILTVSDNRASIAKPGWLQNKGIGYTVTSMAGKLEFVAKANVDGQIRLLLKGINILDAEDKTKRIPYWIDYNNLTINGTTIFDTVTPAWHDKAYNHDVNVKAGEEIKIQIEWLPHRSDI